MSQNKNWKEKAVTDVKGKISLPLASFLALLVFSIILLIPGLGIFFSLGGMILSLFLIKKFKGIRRKQRGDLTKVVGIIFLYTIVWIGLGVYSFATVSFFRLIIAGLIADSIMFGFGFLETVTAPTLILPFILSLIEGVVVFFAVMLIVGGITGVILGIVASLIAMLLPIPFFFLITVSFIIMKIIVGFIGTFISGVI